MAFLGHIKQMRCETYNEDCRYAIEPVAPLVDELERWVPIRYDALSVAFLTEATICAVHRQFLNDPNPTDVITFPALGTDTERAGEICISIDAAIHHVRRQHATATCDCLADELTLYLVHGWLHLAHYDDGSDRERRQMRAMERRGLRYLLGQPIRRIAISERKGR